MTVRENMAFGLRNARVPKEEIDTRVAEAARVLEIHDHLEKKPGQMSGGQRQRVAIGRAIVREPQVFLFDEPLSNLDANLRVQMRTEIARLHHRLGATMIYVTHDQTEAMTMADRIVVLRAGVIEQVGAPLDLYERPANMFVAGFLGAPKINFLKGTVAAANGTEAEIEVAGGVRIPARVRPGAASPGDAVTLGLRPELLNTSSDGPLLGRVEVVEQLGATQLAYSTLPDGTGLVAELRDRRPPAVGSDARFAIGPGIRHVFDAQGYSITLPEGPIQ
jgi:ABC-type sugar transport system ATPase subunit